MDENWGEIEIVLDKCLAKYNCTKSRLVREAGLQYTQMNAYFKNEVVRPDLGVLSRICKVLNCEVGDLLEYHSPPEHE